MALADPAIQAAPELDVLASEAEEYLAYLLERWRSPLADVVDSDLEPETYVPGMHYWVDAMLEHAVMHPIRHEFQLKELMHRQGKL